ncbi:DUF692 domain-containing protein [Pleionea sp. CnH1-48]|uniref:MNIO family bufferin maturase n=1 Tax=Pleionea sp. CnH1-48 TaxID=2954494 RepID=UPI00209806A7|nr:DUF692 domain-containing protein [Pleionea sp. CnH1-48]MCO7227159.1 DUF692 domain-containing protein [Pleionea sp. CnH1-48]
MQKKYLGFGLGLRTDHYHHVLEHKPDVDWFEVISENYMVGGGKPKHFLHSIREHYPIVMHGVSMSIGSCDPLNMDYLRSLRALISEVQPEWVSDHLCWTSIGGVNSHDLMPMPYTEEAIDHLVQRITQVQDFLGQQILLENVSSYITYEQSKGQEWEFYSEVVERADCLMLLDINNVYVSARNHHFDAVQYLDALNPERVMQFHLAGHTDYGDYVVDTHDHPVVGAVWDLYEKALQRFGPVSTMIERDDDIPAFAELDKELRQAKDIAYQTLPEFYGSHCLKYQVG